MAGLTLIEDDADHDPVLQAALGPALLEWLAESGSREEYLRIFSPSPTLGFTGRDCVTSGIAEAVRAAERHGFTAVRRGPGGRAAAYHRGTWCIDQVGPARGPHLQITERFAAMTDRVAAALRSVGVPAEIGAVPGEFCPGDYSISDGAGHKLVGTAQRLTSAGWLFATVIVVDDAEPLRDVLLPVYAALGLDFDPATVGAVAQSVPGVPPAQLRADLLDAFSRPATARIGLPARVLDLARARLGWHSPR